MYIKVHVVTGAKEEKIQEEEKDKYLVWVKEKPERNMANKRVLALLRAHFGKGVRLVSGHHSPHKIVSIE